jgi:hypothetical protein
MKLVNWAIGIVIVSIVTFGIIKLVGNLPKELTARYQIYTLKGDTFDLDVTVLVTPDVDFATNFVQENLDSTVTIKDFDARAVSFPTVDGKSPIIWMADTDDQGIIAHEIFHTSLNIMYWAGMELNSETEEAFAYEVQHLTTSFYNQINKIQ